METKPRILYLKKILEERTDEEHPLSTTQLINILNDEYGISAHRTTVTKDIAALHLRIDTIMNHPEIISARTASLQTGPTFTLPKRLAAALFRAVR